MRFQLAKLRPSRFKVGAAKTEKVSEMTQQRHISNTTARGKALAVALLALFALLGGAAQSAPVPVDLELDQRVLDIEPSFVAKTTVDILEAALGAPGTVAESERPHMAAVPLPAAAWLFGSALFGFVFLSNRKRV